MKRTLMVILTLVLLAVSVSALAAGTSILYVKTANGKGVNVRSSPNTGDNIIGTVPYGGQVVMDWSYAGNDGWTKIVWGGRGDGYIMSRFLVDTKPGPAPTASKDKDKTKKENETEKKKLDNELKSEKAAEEFFYIVVRPTRTSGWINFRSGPSKTTKRIASFGDGKELLVMGETNNWYRARDPKTDKVGYIHKSYTAKLAKKYVMETETTSDMQKLGRLNVNGEFDLTCKLPEGYRLQVVDYMGEKIIASVLSEDMTRPQLYLSIAFDETYSTVERMNDLSEDDLALLEDTFRDMNDVEITYMETGHGTKLLVARETGTDTDFVDILGIYKGYFLEFNMTPNPDAQDQTLSNEQIQMCVDFLTDLEFTPAA